VTDWALALRLGALAIVAAAIGIPAQFRAVVATGGAASPNPPSPLPAVVATAALGVAAALLGCALAPHVGLVAPLLGARMGTLDLARVASHIGAGALGGIVAVSSIPIYYLVAPRVDPGTFRAAEAVRMAMGLPARVAIGGIVEEIVYRWGLLALLAWIGVRLAGAAEPCVRWGSMVGAALLFGAGHLPGAARLSGRLTLGIVVVSLAVNGWLGLVAGWLVWNRGLAAAMIAHATAHVVWAGLEPAAARGLDPITREGRPRE